MNKKNLIKILKGVSDPTRIDILSCIYLHPNISGKEILVSQKISQPTLSFHLNKLEQVGIIKSKKVGQSHHYCIHMPLAHECDNTIHAWLNNKNTDDSSSQDK